MNTQSNITRQCPRSGRPRHKADTLHPNDRKAHHHGWITDILVIQTGLKVTQRSTTRSTKGHNLVPLIHQILIKQLLKHPPHTLHKRRIHRLVIILKIHPPSQSSNRPLPLLRIPRHNPTTRIIILIHPHLQHLITMGNSQLLINLIFHRQTVTIPPSTANDTPTCHYCISRHDIFDSPGEDVTVVRKTGGEWWAIVEGVFFVAAFDAEGVLGFKGGFGGPFGADFFFGFGEVEGWGEGGHGCFVFLLRLDGCNVA
mmetsp:Transcript_5227/g.7984  ORF Transcript_5227/g.7984 Transcript_5227/m.7984 type:complete len:256 (-) Transcript_5227:28-795(-)